MNNENTSMITLTGQGDTLLSRYSSPSAGKREGIMKLNKDKLNEIRTKVNDAMKPIGNELDIKISLGNITFDDFNATCKLKIEVVNDGQIMTKEYTDLLWFADMRDLDIDKAYKLNNRSVKITGYSAKSSKYPIIVTDLNTEKQYKVTRDWLKRVTA